ncbi:unnamed protein product [Lota lota]
MGMVANGRCMTFGCMVGFCLLLGGVRGQATVVATMGEDVTLPCSYDAVYYGALGVCWGRGPIPKRGCNDEVLRSDGSTVVSRLSERYRLTRSRGQGDVSLTIMHVQDSDSGVYGCRVDIPGWFNDHIHEMTLSVVAAPPHPVRLEVGEVKEKTITVRWSPGPDGGSPITGYRIDFKDKTTSWDSALTTKGISPALTQVTLIDMRPNKGYNIRMFTINSQGLSKASNVVAVTTRESAPEGPPLDVQLEALTPRSIKITWKPPKMELRNGVLRSYHISYRGYDSASSQFERWHHQSVAATRELESTVLNNLRPATQYSVLIVATTAAGDGPAFTAPHCSTLVEGTPKHLSTMCTFNDNCLCNVYLSVPPDPPVLELLEVNDKQVSFRWTAGFDGGVPISSYDLEYKKENASWDSTQRFGDYRPNQTESTIIEMHPSTYHIRMFARSSVGSSQASNVLTFVIAEKEGQQTDTPTTLIPIGTQAAVWGEDIHGSHPAVVAVPVLLVVVVIIALVVAWQIRRTKSMMGNLVIRCFTRDMSRLRNSETLSEL